LASQSLGHSTVGGLATEVDVVLFAANRLPVADVVGEIQLNAELHRVV